MTKRLNGNQIETGDFVFFGDRWVKLVERRSLPVDRRVQQFVAQDRAGDSKIINLRWTDQFAVWTERQV